MRAAEALPRRLCGLFLGARILHDASDELTVLAAAVTRSEFSDNHAPLQLGRDVAHDHPVVQHRGERRELVGGPVADVLVVLGVAVHRAVARDDPHAQANDEVACL